MESNVIKSKIAGFLLAPMLLVLASCAEDPAFDRQIDASSIDDLVKQVGTYGDPEPGFPETEIPEEAIIGQSETASDGKQFVCNTRKYQKRTVIEQLTLAAFDDRTATNTASLYPGSLIKLKEYVDENDLTGIGGYARNSIEISSTLGDIRTVDDPSQRGNVDKAIKEIESQTGSFAAQVQSEVTYAYSFEQAMLEFGLDASYLGNSVSSKFKTENTVEEKNIFIKFFQVYHTVSVPNPIRPSDLFGNAVSSKDLESITGSGKPLGYISEVAYGRMLIGQFTYRGTEFSSQVELEGEFNKGLANIKAETTIENSSKFVNSTFKVSILGGDAEQASVVAGSGAGMEAVQAAFDFMKDGIGDASLGVPVQFKVRYLSDNSLFAIGGAAEYFKTDCDKIAKSVRIKSVKLEGFRPKTSDGGVWDPGTAAPNPDVYPAFFEGGTLTGHFQKFNFNGMESGDLPHTYKDEKTGRNVEFLVTNLSKSFKIVWYDADATVFDINKDDKMGENPLSWSNYGLSSGDPYPSSITLSNGPWKVTLGLSWNF